MVRLLAIAALAAIVATGCEPARQMRVRDSQHPSNVDDNVHFRTTYYFRTFDWCYGKGIVSGEPNVLILPETDSLYRFKMTGKSSALQSIVHFESGTLPASDIDPFNAKIDFDEEEGAFRFISETESKRRFTRREANEDIASLLELLERIEKSELDDSEKGTLRTKISEAMQDGVNEMTGNSLGGRSSTPDEQKREDRLAFYDNLYRSNQKFQDSLKSIYNFDATKLLGDDTESNVATGGASSETQSKGGKGETGCGKSAPLRRGFQIMGPEGWRTFNQDERLIMAMSIDDKPLISVLQQYADRILNAKVGAADQLLLSQEHLRVLRADNALDAADAAAAFDAAAKQFGVEEQQ